MSTKTFAILFLTIVFCQCAKAQFFIDDVGLESEVFKARVSLVSEFMRRFNGEEMMPGLDSTIENNKAHNLLSLFDVEMFGDVENDSLYLQACSFVKDVLEDSVRINYSDTAWFAIAPCHGKFKGRDVDFYMFLNVEKRGEDMYKWVINGVKGEIFDLAPPDSSKKVFLLPDDHETNFIGLNRITHETDGNIVMYRQKQFSLDQTSVFYAFVNAGLLDIEYVNGLQFVFLQVPCWQFSIRRFDRQTHNSGWLVTSFDRMSNQDKTEFLNNMYHHTSKNIRK
ncbi:MAG: hypothetical protein J6U21_09970 [Bacteroidales bacterium]|nr:hypothetical protein [Bacteroidales bacterium]